MMWSDDLASLEVFQLRLTFCDGDSVNQIRSSPPGHGLLSLLRIQGKVPEQNKIVLPWGFPDLFLGWELLVMLRSSIHGLLADFIQLSESH